VRRLALVSAMSARSASIRPLWFVTRSFTIYN
jgi:hypothetical protein